MNFKVLSSKPVVPILPELFFISPGRNYLNSVLRFVYEMVEATSVFDAGAGRLRNYSLFPDDYTGVAIDLETMEKGVEDHKDIIAKHNPPKIIRANLDEDFSTIGTFSFCVCTATLDYLKNSLFSIHCMMNTLDTGGSLFFNTAKPEEGLWLANKIGDRFRNVSVFHYESRALPQDQQAIFWELMGKPRQAGLDFSLLSPEEIQWCMDQTHAEMISSADSKDNFALAVFAKNKIH